MGPEARGLVGCTECRKDGRAGPRWVCQGVLRIRCGSGICRILDKQKNMKMPLTAIPPKTEMFVDGDCAE